LCREGSERKGVSRGAERHVVPGGKREERCAVGRGEAGFGGREARGKVWGEKPTCERSERSGFLSLVLSFFAAKWGVRTERSAVAPPTKL